MNSEQKNEIEALLNETETNIKLIEVYSESFLVPVLNEWRYATRHMVNVLFNQSDEEEYRKAIAHLQRARFDSYDFLLVYQIESIKRYRDAYINYVDVIKNAIPDFDKWLIKLNEAVRLHRECIGQSNRSCIYDKVKETTSDLGGFLNTLNDTEGVCLKLIRRDSFRFFREFFKWILGIIVALVTLVGLIINLFSR